MTGSVTLAPPSPRDAEIQLVVLQLVEAFAWREAREVLDMRIREMARGERTHIQRVFLTYMELPRETRPDFLTYAHHRRRPSVEGGGE